ncbi:hypothetical protein HH214_05570 [Mucilaginibacter robiniae]|uniref:DUF3098 domain-containing protein n=1 Tax=Mucilaginibacter robiniae TaxID=2728022 RepID=A0A7L5DZ50_9SPHI|nr:hypothetical protein [Mucilaginibacter robiniae]QJD95377.1 hypothetical protein HH214_05570 [Mucilaginibacter robiniae]
MRRISIILIIVGAVLLIAGGFFYKQANTVADSKPITVDYRGHKSFQWPVYTGIILLFLGATFNLATRRNGKADHTRV